MTTETSPSTPPSTPPRRRFGIPLFIASVLASALAGAGVMHLAGHGGDRSQPPATAAAKDHYQCPMHPSVVEDHPGDCPICGMKLVKMTSAAEPNAKGPRTVLFYRSPMDPKVTSPVPRKDEMGMDYVPVYSDEVNGQSDVDGLATVNIDPSRQQLIGLHTAPVQRGPVGGAWRTVGRIAMDETRVRHINVKIPAYVERVYVDFIGKAVRRGEPLFSVYSPELLAAQDEFLLALRTHKALGSAEGFSSDGDALIAAAKRKLQLWDVPDSEIQRLERTGVPMKNLTFSSPISGVVTKKDVVDGMKLDAGAMPYEIVDLSEVWVLADVYEGELQNVKLGMPAALTLKAFPNRAFKGKVSFIDPLLDPKTRTVKVRLAFSNPTGELRPEMFGEVMLQGAARDGLQIPADALIDSGTKTVVFVAAGEGKFQPREVKVGASDGTNVEIVSGVSEGEKVVTRANFLIDSESRLRASLAALTPPSGPVPAAGGEASGGSGTAPSEHTGHGEH